MSELYANEITSDLFTEFDHIIQLEHIRSVMNLQSQESTTSFLAQPITEYYAYLFSDDEVEMDENVDTTNTKTDFFDNKPLFTI